MKSPTPEEIRKARKAAGMTQEEAAEIIYIKMNSWMRYETSKSNMHPGLFELFLLKTGQKKL